MAGSFCSLHFLLLGLAVSTAGMSCSQPVSGAVSRPNLVLVTVDTLRPDHLGTHGHGSDTSPNLDRLASEGLLFEHALSQAPWTLPSLASLHTTMYPSEHGAIGSSRGLPDAPITHIYAGGRYGFERGFDGFIDGEQLADLRVNSELITVAALELLDARPASSPFFLWAHYFDPHGPFVRHPQYGFAAGQPELEARATSTRTSARRAGPRARPQ